eukprot:3867107-Pyramimonas_sp.AAC.1
MFKSFFWDHNNVSRAVLRGVRRRQFLEIAHRGLSQVAFESEDSVRQRPGLFYLRVHHVISPIAREFFELKPKRAERPSDTAEALVRRICLGSELRPLKQ